MTDSRWRRRLFFAGMLLTVSASAELGGPKVEADRLWFFVLAQSPLKSLSDYDHRFTVEMPRALEGASAPDLFLEFRQTASGIKVASVRFQPFEGTTLSRGRNQNGGIEPEALKVVKDIPDGGYMVAIVDGTTRKSNVCPLAIDHRMDVAKLPVLDSVVLESPPYRHLPMMGIRVCAPENAAPELRLSTFEFPILEIDGVTRHLTQMAGHDMFMRNPATGKPYPPEPGTRFALLVDPMTGRKPETEPAATHTLVMSSAGYEIKEPNFTSTSTLGDAWDNKESLANH